MLIIFGNFLENLCLVEMTHLKNHLLKHFLGFLTLLFFAAITVFKDNRVDVVFIVFYFMLFILISKTNYRFFIAIAILFFNLLFRNLC